VLLGFVAPELGVLAGTGLLLLMLGALVAHIRQRDGLAEMAPAIVVIALLGLYLPLAVAAS
jgi:hypothetical protein